MGFEDLVFGGVFREEVDDTGFEEHGGGFELFHFFFDDLGVEFLEIAEVPFVVQGVEGVDVLPENVTVGEFALELYEVFVGLRVELHERLVVLQDFVFFGELFDLFGVDFVEFLERLFGVRAFLDEDAGIYRARGGDDFFLQILGFLLQGLYHLVFLVDNYIVRLSVEPLVALRENLLIKGVYLFYVGGLVGS